MKLVLATTNKHKVTEIKNKFASLGALEIVSLEELPAGAPNAVENGATFAENALLKAAAIAAFSERPAMADDSGLCVDALDGRPGIFSARYGGENTTDAEKNALLLKELSGITERQARFVCAIAIVFPDGLTLTAEGTCYGAISQAPSGVQGFGYDPVFFLPQYNCTMAEISLDEKNRISHRALALEKAAGLLHEIISGK
jgi:XTP/dITP diphosphohydrolase